MPLLDPNEKIPHSRRYSTLDQSLSITFLAFNLARLVFNFGVFLACTGVCQPRMDSRDDVINLHQCKTGDFFFKIFPLTNLRFSVLWRTRKNQVISTQTWNDIGYPGSLSLSLSLVKVFVVFLRGHYHPSTAQNIHTSFFHKGIIKRVNFWFMKLYIRHVSAWSSF